MGYPKNKFSFKVVRIVLVTWIDERECAFRRTCRAQQHLTVT